MQFDKLYSLLEGKVYHICKVSTRDVTFLLELTIFASEANNILSKEISTYFKLNCAFVNSSF